MISINCPATDDGIRVLRNEGASMYHPTPSHVVSNQGSLSIDVTAVVGTGSTDTTPGTKYVCTYLQMRLLLYDLLECFPW